MPGVRTVAPKQVRFGWPSSTARSVPRWCPHSCGKEKWRVLPVGEVHDQHAACQGGRRRNAPWGRVSARQSGC